MTALTFRAVAEPEPGPKWAALFHGLWPAYRRWWAREGLAARPSYRETRAALARHMPELMGLYDRWCWAVGGGDLEARFLGHYVPPPYLSGCSQAIWPGAAPMMVRNYDYHPDAFDALILCTDWDGRRVVGTSDGLCGLVDGMNDAGLAVSLTFGGRRVVGEGFGVPLILRYVLQTCETAAEAGRALRRIPCHMSYNVTVIDRERHYLTAYLAPDRVPAITRAAVATNHQERVEWARHARFTATVERERYLLSRLQLHRDTAERFTRAFLRPPLYSTAFADGFGTLFTAVYEPGEGRMTHLWPDRAWVQHLHAFDEGVQTVLYPDVVV